MNENVKNKVANATGENAKKKILGKRRQSKNKGGEELATGIAEIAGEAVRASAFEVPVQHETDAQLFDRFLALRRSKSEAEVAMVDIRDKLLSRAKFEGGTATFACGGKLTRTMRTELGVPKELPESFFDAEENEPFISIVPNEKVILEILKSLNHPQRAQLLALGFELKTRESISVVV
jgi:hypothetical protein